MKREFLRYTAVSGAAWLVDTACLYLGVVGLGIADYLAAAIAYTIGLALHYALSVRYVFRYRRLRAHSRAEMLSYALTGVAGVGLSAAIVHLGGRLGLPLIASKVAATLVTFAVVYAIRKITLFSRREKP